MDVDRLPDYAIACVVPSPTVVSKANATISLGIKKNFVPDSSLEFCSKFSATSRYFDDKSGTFQYKLNVVLLSFPSEVIVDLEQCKSASQATAAIPLRETVPDALGVSAADLHDRVEAFLTERVCIPEIYNTLDIVSEYNRNRATNTGFYFHSDRYIFYKHYNGVPTTAFPLYMNSYVSEGRKVPVLLCFSTNLVKNYKIGDAIDCLSKVM